MAWVSKRQKWDWRAYLSADELVIIEKADKSRERIAKAQALHEAKYGRAFQLISNRAIHRAKWDARTE